MRKLGLKDAFSVARIIKAADLKTEIISFAQEVKAKKETDNIEKIGMEFLVTVISAAANNDVEAKVYELYADLKGSTPEEVALLTFDEIKADIAEIIKENDLKSFFRSASFLTSKA